MNNLLSTFVKGAGGVWFCIQVGQFLFPYLVLLDIAVLAWIAYFSFVAMLLLGLYAIDLYRQLPANVVGSSSSSAPPSGNP